MTKWFTPLLIGLFILNPAPICAQEPTNATTNTNEQLREEQAEREKKALILLEQVINDSQLLRLPENRISTQIDVANLLWESNQGRARSLFAQAGDGIAEVMRTTDPSERRRGPNPARTVSQLRQKLVLTVARHEAALAFQLLAATRPEVTTPTESRGSRANSEENLEQMLLARIAELDPKLALQNAQDLLDKGQFPRTLTNVLLQLQTKDKEAAAKLEEKMLKRLQAANYLTNQEAGSLAFSLLRPGPRIENTSIPPGTGVSNSQTPLLAQTAYVELLGTVIDSALKAAAPPRNQRTATTPRGRRNPGGAQTGASPASTTAQAEQTIARGLAGGMRNLLPQIEQYLPARAQAVRDKLTELGMGDGTQRAAANEMRNLMQQASAEGLLSAAQTAPPQMQSRLYQRAAQKALEEGNPEKARQIATEHLEGNSRDRILQQVEFRLVAEKTDATRLDQLQANLYSLRSDDERIDLLVQLSYSHKQNDPKLALQLLEQARQLANRRASNYQHFEKQLKVAEALRELDPALSFEALEPGISQLNELLSAAATLSGFEINVFRDGELPLESRNNLSRMIARYGQALGLLARTDFDRAQALANRFNLTEPRILARMSIVQGLLGNQVSTQTPNLGSREVPGVRSISPE